MNKMLEFSDKDFKIAVIKMLQQSITKTITKAQQINRITKREPNENQRTEKYNSRKF